MWEKIIEIKDFFERGLKGLENEGFVKLIKVKKARAHYGVGG